MRKILIMLMAFMPLLSLAITPTQVLDNAANKIRSAGSLRADFTGNVSGTLLSQGNKFSIVAGGFGIWFNGKDMWTYSKNSDETSLTTPTPSELLETNPIEIIKSQSKKFTASKVSENATTYTLKLTPVDKTTNVRTATLVINTKTWLPSSIDMVFTNNSRMTLNISSIKTGIDIPVNKFVYPQKEYPGVEVVDLR